MASYRAERRAPATLTGAAYRRTARLRPHCVRKHSCRALADLGRRGLTTPVGRGQ